MHTKGKETQQYIRKQARCLFEKKGFHRVTMKDICEATGLSRGGLYGHYDSTNQIFSAILQELMDQQAQKFQILQQTNTSATKILVSTLEQYRVEMLDSKHSLSLAIYEYYSQFPKDDKNPLVMQYQNSKTMWDVLLQHGIATGEFHSVDTQAIIDILIFSYQGVRLFSSITEIDKDIANRIIDSIKKMIIKEKNSNVYES